MATPKHSWPISAWLVMAFGIYALLLSVVGVGSVLAFQADKPFLGVMTFWSSKQHCVVVSPSTPATWPAIQEGWFRPDDCIYAVESISPTAEEAYATLLSEHVDASGSNQFVNVSVRRGEEWLERNVPVVRRSVRRILESLLVLIITGLLSWTIVTVILFAQPRAEANLVMAAFGYMAALLTMGSQHGLPDSPGLIYTGFVLGQFRLHDIFFPD